MNIEKLIEQTTTKAKRELEEHYLRCLIELLYALQFQKIDNIIDTFKPSDYYDLGTAYLLKINGTEPKE